MSEVDYHHIIIALWYECCNVSGGSVPVFDEVILSTSLMDNVISLDEAGGKVYVEQNCMYMYVHVTLLHSFLACRGVGVSGWVCVGSSV